LANKGLDTLTYPHDWGFVPSTKADDGDPLDIMVIHDATTFPGIVLTCRIIGILQIEQKSKGKAERNDRLFAVPRRSHSEQAIRDVRDLSKPIQQELEKFFIATDELEDKKLEIIGCWRRLVPTGPFRVRLAVRRVERDVFRDLAPQAIAVRQKALLVAIRSGNNARTAEPIADLWFNCGGGHLVLTRPGAPSSSS
jgi:inorganic pyrophosphatase